MFLYIHHEYQTSDVPDRGRPKERLIPLSDIREIRPADPEAAGPDVRSAIITDRCTWHDSPRATALSERLQHWA